MYNNIYIPRQPANPNVTIPSYHPTLIMQDYQTDTTHHLSCGCNRGACIEECSWWYTNLQQQNTTPVKTPMEVKKSGTHGSHFETDSSVSMSTTEFLLVSSSD